eukprot:TRINITY_DN4745_c0_g1_i2.p1 TRINITY_DN4745_c0_g1~~TRINITY_DN4745_c0_g1_i2.p1  ORF type:complete len:250 (-),score=42.99 TRINITY_DN4745_c0_g1_i2:150-899(-)
MERQWFQKSYIADWVASVIVLILSLVVPSQITPFQKFYSTKDPALSYPDDPDIVPSWAAGVLAVLTPIVLFILFWIRNRQFHDLHHSLLGLLEAMTLNMLATESIKTAAGRPRPHFFADVNARDSRLSFPSGHSSISFCGMTFCAFYLSGKLGTFRKEEGHFWKLLLILVFYAAAIVVAVSRTMDYHHNYDDILAGMLIGITSAYFGYFLNFHSLMSKRSHLPKRRGDNISFFVLEGNEAEEYPLQRGL